MYKMYLDDSPSLEALYHEDVSLAMLRSALSRHGDQARFARETGVVSRGFLSYVLSEKDAGGQRRLSPAKADEIAAHLPWPPEVRDAFVMHVTLQREARMKRLVAIEQLVCGGTSADVLSRVRSHYATITPGLTAAAAGRRYRAVRDECIDLLRLMRPRHALLDFAEICLILCTVQGILDRPDEVLFYSKIATHLLDSRNPDEFRREAGRYDDLLMQAWRQQASAYHIMGLPRWSLGACADARYVLNGMRLQSAYSEVRLCAIEIRAWSNMPRFSIREVRKLADQAHEASERLASEQEYQAERLNIHRALGHAETQHGNVKRAKVILQPLAERAEAQTGVNLVLRTGLLKSYAQLQFKTRDAQGGATTLKSALKLAVEAGLAHQIRQGREQFGPVADVLLRELAAARPITTEY